MRALRTFLFSISSMNDENDGGFWLRYMLGTWLRQVVDELTDT
jgi:hypothetical protein